VTLLLALIALAHSPAPAADTAPPEPYSTAVRLVEELYLEPEAVTAPAMLRAAAHALEHEVPWLVVRRSGAGVVLMHGGGQVLGDVRGRPRVDRAAQHDQRPVAQVGGDLADGLLEDRHRRPEELVDRGADDDDELIRALDHRRVGPELEATRRQDAREELVGAILDERHVAGGDAVERRLVRVEDADPQAGFGEGQAEGQADMAPAPEHDDVEVAWSVGHGVESSGAVRGVTTRRWS